MPSLASHHSSEFSKLLLLGDSKAGKTTSLACLVPKFKLRILDFDNLLNPFASRVRAMYPEFINNVEYRSMRDELKGTETGMKIDGKPRAWIDSLKMLNHWKYTDPETGEVIDYGIPADWGPDTILVIDSLSRWCDAAYDFHASATTGGAKGPDGRMVYGNAQDDVEKQLAGLTSPNFRTNVILICHGVFIDLDDGTRKIFPQGVGQKLSPKIPQYFPDYIQLTRKADNRVFKTQSTNMIGLATSVPMPPELPADTGLAQFFEALRQPPSKSDVPAASAPARPKPVAIPVRR